MSGDIVKRLWYTSAYLRTMEETDIREVIEDAADEIERLRRRLQACQSNEDHALTDDTITQNERWLLGDNTRLREERQDAFAEIERLQTRLHGVTTNFEDAYILKRKADDEIERLRSLTQLTTAEVKRLRAAGDAMYHALVLARCDRPNPHTDHVWAIMSGALIAYEEARHA